MKINSKVLLPLIVWAVLFAYPLLFGVPAGLTLNAWRESGTLRPLTTCATVALTMPRQPRLDAPGTLHHVMVRGIERTAVFRDDGDRADFVARLATLAAAGAWTVYAWALLPNHAHLLVRTGHRPLARTMRALLTGYAGAFNRRHHRVGHLFQNRYKSILCEEEPYLLELQRQS
jgi:REP element-mobilizing transposase RayT